MINNKDNNLLKRKKKLFVLVDLRKSSLKMSKNLKIAVKSFSIHNTTTMGSDFYSWDNSERSIGNVSDRNPQFKGFERCVQVPTDEAGCE